jgi:anaerobic carbon-monoxide dehydrogenase iron sulfur subunit
VSNPSSDHGISVAEERLSMISRTRKHLIFDAELCTGCMECENACSIKHESKMNTGTSRIRVQCDSKINFAILCQHCEDPAPCQKACPQGAIGRNEIFNAITISKKQCFGCGECLGACPFGAIFMDEQSAKAYKCDLCKGNPECVKHCAFGALTFGEVTREIEEAYKELFQKVKLNAAEKNR